MNGTIKFPEVFPKINIEILNINKMSNNDIFGLHNKKGKATGAKLTRLNPRENVFGIYKKPTAQIAENAQKAVENAESDLSNTLETFERESSVYKDESEQYQQKRKAEENAARLRMSGRDPHGGVLQLSEHEKMEHWKRGMQRTWNAEFKPLGQKRNAVEKLRKNIEMKRKYIATLKKTANKAKRNLESEQNLLVFPKRDEELQGLFEMAGNVNQLAANNVRQNKVGGKRRTRRNKN